MTKASRENAWKLPGIPKKGGKKSCEIAKLFDEGLGLIDPGPFLLENYFIDNNENF